MKTFFLALIISVFSFSAFAGFVTGEQETIAYSPNSKMLKIYGHSVELGRSAPDMYGNFDQQEVMAMTLMLMDPLKALPHGDELRQQRHQKFLIHIVKGATYKVERKAERGYLRIPALTAITLTIPATASYDEVGQFLAKNITLTAPAQEGIMAGLVEPTSRRIPRELNGCEMHLFNLIGTP